MNARLTVMLAGNPMRNIGEIVEGPEAARLCAAGFAAPLEEERTAIDPVAVVKAVKTRKV